jgi:glycosyltransferase involved in cell wall biosynthesis
MRGVRLLNTRPYHIVLISPCMGRFGGLESFVLTLASGLSKLPGLSVEIVFKKAGDFSFHNDLKRMIQKFGVETSFCSRSSRPLWRHIKKADLVHLQNPCPDVVLMASLLRKPLLVNVINHKRGASSVHQLLWSLCLKLARQRFYISEFVRCSWEQSSRPWRGSQVVFPICELSPLAPLPLKDRSGFVFVGRWIENKGLDTLVEAYALSGLSTETWPLRLLGDGPLRERILNRLVELGLDGKVEVPGFLDEVEKADRIRRSRFAIIPPNTNEDFGLVAIEARHLGVPCIITRDGGVPEAAGPYSISCSPGSIESLVIALKQAATMSEGDYRSLAESAHDSLEADLIRPDFYRETYQRMIR